MTKKNNKKKNKAQKGSSSGSVAPPNAQGASAQPSTASQPPDTSTSVDDVSSRLAAALSFSAPPGGLPVKIMIRIVIDFCQAHARGHDILRVQSDIASLRLASKLLSGVATSFFYRIINVRNSGGVESLVTSLQPLPELCSVTRAIWWGQLQHTRLYFEKPLLRFPSLDEVAFCSMLRLSGTRTGVAVGEHYGLRDKGPWCAAAEDANAYDLGGWMQCTPTVTIMQELDFTDSKAIWGVHFVVSTMKDMHRKIPRTATDVALSFMEHPQVNDMELEAALSTLLDRRQYPILQRLTIALVYSGRPEGGLPTAEDRALCPGLGNDPDSCKRRELTSWMRRLKEFQHAVSDCSDRRVSCEIIGNPMHEAVRLDTRFQDVQDHVQMGWRHRVYFGRGRIWRGTPMFWGSTSDI